MLTPTTTRPASMIPGHSAAERMGTLALWAGSMLSGEPVTVVGINHMGQRTPVRGVVQRIEREDGSGKRFIVTLHNGASVFVSLD